MLRLIVLLLLLANGAFFAWAQGFLLPWGLGPARQSEPQRLAQQVRPQALQVATGEQARRLEAAAAQPPRAPECLLAAPLPASAEEPLREALQSWPPQAWTLAAQSEPGRWIVYMGKYASAQEVTRKQAELRQLGLSFEPVAAAALEPGLSLGGFSSEATAAQYLQRVAERGVRSARVVQERPEQQSLRLELPAVDEALRARLDELRPLLAGQDLRACR